MRFVIITSLAFSIAVGILTACNSKDSIIPQTVQNPQAQSQTQTTQTPPPDNARRSNSGNYNSIGERRHRLQSLERLLSQSQPEENIYLLTFT